MTRRMFVTAAACAPALFGDAAAEAWDVVAAMAAALAEGNAPAFLKRIDLKLPGYDTLARDVEGMLLQAEAHSGVNLIRNEGNDGDRAIELDWELRLRRKGDDLRIDVRRQAVTVKLSRERRGWMVTQLDPISLFAPPNFR